MVHQSPNTPSTPTPTLAETADGRAIVEAINGNWFGRGFQFGFGMAIASVLVGFGAAILWVFVGASLPH